MSLASGYASILAQQFASSSYIFPSPASGGNLRSRSATPKNAPLFLFARNLLYLHVFVTSASGLLGARQQPATRHPRKRESLGSGQAGVRNKEECDGTHAT